MSPRYSSFSPRQPLLTLLICLFAGQLDGQQPAWDGLMGELLSGGIAIGDGEQVRLGSPIVDPRSGDSGEASRSDIAGKRGWKRFSRNSDVAPINIKMDYLKSDDGERLGQRVHVVFIVHADVETLRDSDVMSRLYSEASESAEPDEGLRSRSVEDRELEQVGISDTAGVSSSIEFVLLKKIELHWVTQTERLDRDDFFVVALKHDPRFSNGNSDDDRLRNCWTKRERDDRGQIVRGDSESYAGAAGYLVVSRVLGEENASLVEAEIVFHEPQGWFSGSNLLRSKVPLIIQESVRKFRRRVSE